MNTREGILQWNSRARRPAPHRQWGPDSVLELIHSPASVYFGQSFCKFLTFDRQKLAQK